jgi:hypothetical protein
VINFRYHIVSIVSVFLALAVGVALGGGPLTGEVDDTLVKQVQVDRQTKADLRSQIASLRKGGKFQDQFAQTVAPDLLAGSLEGRPVSLVVLPDADESAVGAVSEMVGQAGGTVAGTVRVGPALLDATNKQLVDELGSQLLDGAPDVSVSDDAGGYDRIGALIARAIGTDEAGGADADEESRSILAGLSTARLMSVDGEMDQRGSLVLFLAGSGEGSSEDQQGAASIMTAIAEAVDADTQGAVVAGPMDSAHEGGLVAAIRQDVVAARDVSTVDVLGQTSGQVVTVMALAQQAKGKTGHYGAVDAADGAMPGADTGE